MKDGQTVHCTCSCVLHQCKDLQLNLCSFFVYLFWCFHEYCICIVFYTTCSRYLSTYRLRLRFQLLLLYIILMLLCYFSVYLSAMSFYGFVRFISFHYYLLLLNWVLFSLNRQCYPILILCFFQTWNSSYFSLYYDFWSLWKKRGENCYKISLKKSLKPIPLYMYVRPCPRLNCPTFF